MGAHAENPVRELASRAGIYDDYFDHNGHRRVTSDDTRRLILAALGVDASTDESAREALARQDQDAANEVLQPVRVLEAGDPALARLEARAPASRTDGGSWRLEVETEQGDRYVTEGSVARGGRTGPRAASKPSPRLPPRAPVARRGRPRLGE